jgi:capsular exopolysaccharide synthesis family protein
VSSFIQEVCEALEAQQHLSLRDYGRVILRRYRVVVAFAILGLVAGVYMYLTSPSAYRASSEVLIERPSGYVISASVGGLGTATSTKQQTHFLETTDYQQLARALTDIAPRMHLDLRDMATLDDISTVMQSDVLTSKYVTPVRIALYNLPAPGLYSFQQARTLKETPVLRQRMDSLSRMAMGPSFSLTTGWTPDHHSLSDEAVRENIALLADSPLVSALKALGVTDDAADEATAPQDDAASLTSLRTGAKVALAANTIGILADLQAASRTEKTTKPKITDLTLASDVLQAAGEIMQSPFVAKLENGPGKVSWFALSPGERQACIAKAGDALDQRKRQHPSKSEGVWDVGGKEITDGADIISITQTAPTAEEARRAANAMAAIMVWEDRMTKVAEAERSAQFLVPELAGAENNLRRQENLVTAFRKKNRVIDAETQLKGAAEHAADLESQYGEATAGIREAKATLAKTEIQLGGSPKLSISRTVMQNPTVEAVKGDLIKAEAELEGLRGQGYTDEWPAVKGAIAQVQYMRTSLNQQIRESVQRMYIPDPVHAALLEKAADAASAQAGLEARQKAVGMLLGQMNGRFAALPDTEAQLVRLTRGQSLAERQYMDLYGRLIDAKNNRAMRQGNARVVSVALDAGEKVSPRRRNIYIAVILGMFFGCACALALSATDAHLRSAEDISRELKIPVLAHIPSIPAGNTLVVESMPSSAVTEAFRSLRSAIRFMATDNPIHSLAVTSVQRGEAKSAVVANLSASLAQAGLIITAVDADLRGPRLANYFGAASGAGLAEALGGTASAADARRSTRIPGLYFIAAGTPSAGAAELLEKGRIGDVIAGLADGNDMVILDTPPIDAVSDAAVVGSSSDATILVIEAGYVEPGTARTALAKLTQTARANVIGVVLVGGEAPILSDYSRYAQTIGSGSTQTKGQPKA